MVTKKIKINDVVSYSLNCGDNITHADLYVISAYNIQTYIVENNIEFTTIGIIEKSISELLRESEKQPILFNNIGRLEKWKNHIINGIKSHVF